MGTMVNSSARQGHARGQFAALLGTPLGFFLPVLILTAWALFLPWLKFDLVHLPTMRVSQDLFVGRDFINIWFGGHLLEQGQAEAIYNVENYRRSLFEWTGIKDVYAYSYPPSTLFLGLFLSKLSYPAALVVWTLGSLLLFFVAARPYLLKAGLPPWLALVLPACIVNLWAGQYGLLTGALFLIGWSNLDRKPAWSGLAFGLLTIKPHLGVLVAFVLVLQGRWRAIGYACSMCLCMVLASIYFFGLDYWILYFSDILGFQSGLLMKGVTGFHYLMPTTTSMMLQLGAPKALIHLAQSATAIYALLILWLAIKWRASTTDIGLIASTAIFLVLPYAFNYDMTAYSLAVLLFTMSNPMARMPLVRIVTYFAYLLPVLLGPHRHLALATPLVLMIFLWLQLRLATGEGFTAPHDVPASAAAAHSA